MGHERNGVVKNDDKYYGGGDPPAGWENVCGHYANTGWYRDT